MARDGFTPSDKKGCCGQRVGSGGKPPFASSAKTLGLSVIRADQVVVKRVRYLWEGRIPLGAVTLMPGEEGIGKTTVGVRIIADLTRGTLPGESLGTPRDVVVLSLEDSLEDVYAPRIREAGADMSRVHIVKCAVGEDGDEVIRSTASSPRAPST